MNAPSTIEVDIEPEDEDPTETILKKIQKAESEVDNAVVRLQINLPEESESQIRDNDIRDALKSAYYSTVSKDVSRESRIRLGAATVEEVTPVEALRTYLEANYTPERAEILLDYGEKLITGESE